MVSWKPVTYSISFTRQVAPLEISHTARAVASTSGSGRAAEVAKEERDRGTVAVLRRNFMVILFPSAMLDMSIQ